MPHLSSPAIMLRTIEHGDSDIILTAFTLDRGKLSLIAKGAKKSQKRFGGALEIFSALELVWADHHKKGLPFLQEATILDPFDKIRSRYDHMVYASHWCELVYRWMDEGKKQATVYKLLAFALEQLNQQAVLPEILHLIFQLRFLTINGFQPNLEQCTKCRKPLDGLAHPFLFFDVQRGGILCRECNASKTIRAFLSKGTVKQLIWILHTPLTKLHRMRFTGKAIEESLVLLEAFVLHHLGKETKSQKLIKQLASRKEPPVKVSPSKKVRSSGNPPPSGKHQ